MNGLPLGDTPFRRAERFRQDALARFNALPKDLEQRDPAAFEREESRMHAACDAFERAPVCDWREFVDQFDDQSGDFAPTNDLILKLQADARRLLNADAFAAAKQTYLDAKDAQLAYDDACGINSFQASTAAIDAIPAAAWSESERLSEVISDAEDVVMDIPSPTLADFAFKFLIAHGGGRDVDCWDKMLEAEALRFIGREVW